MQKEEPKKELSLICETGIGFSQRDTNVKYQEEKGFLEFKVIRNDGNMDNLKMLTDLKNIIAKQLPKMPKEYIVRLVFDKKHESMVIIKKNNSIPKVLGGICYRPNKEQGFIEIAFLAISSLEQVKGFGTRLMNKLKDHCKLEGIEYFLTYADNNAIGYFKKQGFNQALKMPPEKWKGYIKDYDGGTLMEAYCQPFVEYSHLSMVLKEQKDSIKKIATKFLNVKRKHSYSELDKLTKNIESKEANGVISEDYFNNVPGMIESGWTYTEYLKQIEAEKKGNKSFITQCREIINKMRKNENSEFFKVPVDSKEVPEYYDRIKEPMDIQTLEKNLESGKYKTRESFETAVKLIFNNARMFNPKNSVYVKNANALEKFIEEDLNHLIADE